MVSFEQTSLLPADQFYQPEFCRFFPNTCFFSGGRDRRRKIPILVYLRFLRERWTYLVPCVAPSDWKVEANCDSFQMTSACSLLLTGLGVCSALSRHTASVPPAYFSPCLHFAIKPSKHCSAICKYSWKHPICSRSKLLPVLILCGMVSKLTDGAVSSICSVNSSGEDGAWMGYFSPLSSQQKAAPIYLLL